jgi:predicted peptidase
VGGKLYIDVQFLVGDIIRKWPLIIYLPGGSDRGNDLNKPYSNGIPDQIYRGREFQFVIVAPQCPEHIRFSTEKLV